MLCKDLLKTRVNPIGVKIIWVDEEQVALDEETTIYRIYFSYGYNIFVLEYFNEDDRDCDYKTMSTIS